jgi:hypothetical protein
MMEPVDCGGAFGVNAGGAFGVNGGAFGVNAAHLILLKNPVKM